MFSGGGEGLGVFVTFEGIEGAGKSTLVAGVAERLRAGGERVVAVSYTHLDVYKRQTPTKC